MLAFVIRRRSGKAGRGEKMTGLKTFYSSCLVVESRLSDVLMSVWDVAKQASSVVTMALHCRCYGFLICRMWFNQACHILFWSLSAGLLLMVTTT